jgi:WD40 repeat protein
VLPWPIDYAESRCIFADGGNLLIAGGMQTRQIGCIDSQTGSLLRTATLSSDFVSLNVSRDGKQVLIGQLDRLSCYPADLSEPLWSISSPETVVAVEECRDGRTVACLGYDGKIRLIDIETREMLLELASYPDPGPLLRHQAFYWLDHPDPNTLIFGGMDMAESIRFSAPPARD